MTMSNTILGPVRGYGPLFVGSYEHCPFCGTVTERNGNYNSADDRHGDHEYGRVHWSWKCMLCESYGGFDNGTFVLHHSGQGKVVETYARETETSEITAEYIDHI